jgi:hypothetical protein
MPQTQPYIAFRLKKKPSPCQGAESWLALLKPADRGMDGSKAENYAAKVH